MENKLEGKFNCFGFIIRELLGRKDFFLIKPEDFIKEIYKKFFIEDLNGNVALYFWKTEPDHEIKPELTIDGVHKLQHAAIKIKDNKFKSKLGEKGLLFEHLINDQKILNKYKITDIKVGRISADDKILSPFVESYAYCWCGSAKKYKKYHEDKI